MTRVLGCCIRLTVCRKRTLCIRVAVDLGYETAGNGSANNRGLLCVPFICHALARLCVYTHTHTHFGHY